MSTRSITKTWIAAIQSFSVPVGVEPTSVTSDFMRRLRNLVGQTTAPLTTRVIVARPGLSLRAPDSITWNTETFAQNQNANAIRWGTMYNFRFRCRSTATDCQCDSRITSRQARR